MAIVPARNREPRAQRPYVGYAVAEVGRQHRASNKLSRSAPKRVAVSVNSGLGGAAIGHESVRGRTGETMTGESASSLILRGRRTGQDPGRRENVVQRSSHRPKGR